MSPLRSLAITAAITTLAGCGGVGGAPSADPAPVGGDPSGAWQLTRGTIDGAQVPLLEEARVTAVFDGERISGTAACNGYGGRVSVIDGRIRIAELGATDMACGGEGVMELESLFLGGLTRVEAIGVDGDALAMTGPGVELRFERLPPVPAAEMVDTEWRLDTLVTGDVASNVAGDPAILQLRSDGTFSGSTGCRTFEGRWVEQGDEILAVQLSMIELECRPELAEQDSLVMTVIGDGFVPTVEGDRLTLSDASGDALVYGAGE